MATDQEITEGHTYVLLNIKFKKICSIVHKNFNIFSNFQVRYFPASDVSESFYLLYLCTKFCHTGHQGCHVNSVNTDHGCHMNYIPSSPISE